MERLRTERLYNIKKVIGYIGHDAVCPCNKKISPLRSLTIKQASKTFAHQSLALPPPIISSTAISLVIKIHVSLKLPTLCLWLTR